MIIEAIFENLDAKRSLFAALEAKAKPGAILATNTSSIPLEEIASAMRDPARLVGIHFFNPVPQMMLVEVVVGGTTRADLVPHAAAFVRQIDKLPLPVKSAPGFLVNRVLGPYLMEAMRCVDEGIAPETVDEAALAFGMPMGPIELADTVGLDICMAVGKMLSPGVEPPAKLKALVDAGQLGKKTKRGFYDWSSGKAAKQPAGAVPAGLAERLIGPFVAEARSALADGIVADADLVDAGAIFGTGFAPFRGGPLHYAAERGAHGGVSGCLRDRARRGGRLRCSAWCTISIPALTRGSESPRQSARPIRARKTAAAASLGEGHRGQDLARALSEGRSGGDRRQRVRVAARRVRRERRQVRRAARVSRAWARRSRSASSTRCRPRSPPGCRRRAAARGRASR